MKFLFLLCFLFITITASSATIMQRSCVHCHASEDRSLPYLFSSKKIFMKEKPESRQCVKCHASLAVASKAEAKISWNIPFDQSVFDHFREYESYAHIPDLKDLKKYTNCGLRKFLQSPVSRRFNAKETMFPVLDQDIDKILQEAKLEDCAVSKDQSEVFRGKKLFNDLGCINCHSPAGNAPKLRIGIPLLSKSFFESTLKKNSHNMNKTWIREVFNNQVVLKKSISDKVLMPSFSLERNQYKWLYEYISNSREDISRFVAPNVMLDGAYGKKLYDSVVRNVFMKSCQHCHSDSLEMNLDNKNVFNESKIGASRFSLPTITREAIKSNRLREVLSPGKNCTDSLIVNSLLERHNEWKGMKISPVRGMPLTGEPLSFSAIEQLKNWTKQGCPTGKDFLCDGCVN